MSVPSIVLCAAPGSVTAGVRDVLRDWVALGLVRPFVWLDADSIRPNAPFANLVATHVTAEAAPRVRLQDHLADQFDIGVIRLVAVSSVGAAPSVVGGRVAGGLVASMVAVTGGQVSPLHVVLTRHGSAATLEGLERPGWHTLLLAPQDSFTPSPDRPVTDLFDGSGDSAFVAHAAAGLATTCGLWVGMDRAPFDAVPVGVDDPVVVRTFLRRLDGSAVESRLRAALTDVSRGLPRPRDGSERCEHLQAPTAAATEAARAVLAKHRALLAVPVSEVPRESEKIGAWAAVTSFLRFLTAGLFGAPTAMARAVTAGLAAGVARRVQTALYGGPESRFEVVLRGVNASGLPPGITELDIAAQDVESRLAGVLPAAEQTVPDLEPFWSDVVAGALTLGDAGERSAGLRPAQVGASPVVVRDTQVIAPSPRDSYPMRSRAGLPAGTSTVSPYDLRQHTAVGAALASADDDAARQDAEGFGSWAEHVRATYTGTIGQCLAGELEVRQSRLRSLLEQLRRTPDDADEAALARDQDRVRRLVRDLLLGLLVVVVAGYVVQHFEVLRDRDVYAAVGLLLLAVLLRQLFALIAVHRRVFQLMHRRDEVLRELEAASLNVGHAATGLHRVTVMYQQYLAWAPVLGAFLERPFGPVPEPGPVSRLDGLLPRSVGFGIAEPDEDAITETAHALAPHVFDRGWLSPLWQAFVEDAARRLGPAGLPLRGNRHALLIDQATDEGSLLRQWSALVAEDGVTAGSGDVLWERARAELLRSGVSELCRTLLTRVHVQAQEGHGIRAPMPGELFFGQLADALAGVDRHYLSPQLFTDIGSSAGRQLVRRTVAVGRRDVGALGSSAEAGSVVWLEPDVQDRNSLDLFLVVLQSTAAVPSTELRLRADAEDGRRDPDNPVEHAPDEY